MQAVDDASKRQRDESPVDLSALQPPPQKASRLLPAASTPPPPSQDVQPATFHPPLQQQHHAPHDPVANHANNHLSINYLARRYADDLPLINTNDSLQHSFYLLNSYYEAMDRSESLASNLGAKPLGTILVKRFERLFDGSPRIVHATRASRRSTTVTWLDVAQFAASNSDQYDIMHLEDGKRVCQFLTKNCTVQINEEDWLMIKSGLPQNIIPPQPIAEDEEKELGTLEILEDAVHKVSHLADQVAARARQFNHRLKGRKQAIIERRMAETAISGAAAMRASSPSNVALANGESPAQPGAPRAGDGHADAAVDPGSLPNPAAVSQSIHDELIKSFAATRHGTSTPSRRSTAQNPPQHRNTQTPAALADAGTGLDAALTPSRPSTNATPRNIPQEDGGPYKAAMVLRLELLGKHERIMPPCDRCRRLKIDCLKNLSACIGCTKKHAKCSWKDVTEDEMISSDPHYHRGTYAGFSSLYAAGALPPPPGHGDATEHPDPAAWQPPPPSRLGEDEQGGPHMDDSATYEPQPEPEPGAQHAASPSPSAARREPHEHDPEHEQNFFDAPSAPAPTAPQPARAPSMLDPSLDPGMQDSSASSAQHDRIYTAAGEGLNQGETTLRRPLSDEAKRVAGGE